MNRFILAPVLLAAAIVESASAFDVSAATRSTCRWARSSSLSPSSLRGAADERGDGFCAPSSSPCLSRRQFVASVASAATFAAGAVTAHADEPSNLYYRSKADGDVDPLVTFGKSLENRVADGSKQADGGGSLSFSDIAIPSLDADGSSSSSPGSAIAGGEDLGKALKEKRESQKRAIDPRTHG